MGRGQRLKHPPGKKVCSRCKQTFPRDLEHFHRNRSNNDGLGTYCKVCARQYVKHKTQTDADYKSKQSEYSTRSMAKHSRRHACRLITRKAIDGGLLVRQPCEVCGITPANAHHDDYDRPLDVRWLCVRHHAALHVAERNHHCHGDRWCDECHHWHRGLCTKSSLRWRNNLPHPITIVQPWL